MINNLYNKSQTLENMVEGSFKSVNPLAYYVNNVTDFDSDVVSACIKKDTAALGSLASKGNRIDYDIFICTSKNWHGFVLCVPASVNGDFGNILDVIKSPFDVPDLVLCFTFELCFEVQSQRMYKVRKMFSMFKDIKERIKRSYFIGHYKSVTPFGLQIAAIKSSPHRYAVLLNDCVEFSKEFCIQCLSVCSNGREIENEVDKSIKAATASGFSFEQLSRNVQSSGWLGNFIFGGSDVSTVVSGRYSTCIVIAFILIYPVIVTIVVVLVNNALTK